MPFDKLLDEEVAATDGTMDTSTQTPNRSVSPSTAPAGARLRTLAEFLESSPPDVTEVVSGLVRMSGQVAYLENPELKLHCENDACNGIRMYHNPASSNFLGDFEYLFVTYVCKNCGKNRKTFALLVLKDGQKPVGRIQKLGELPPFGPPIPARVISLVGEDRELFLKGRRAELRGLGIGAFAYYRRVVEEQKGRIIEEISKVAARLGAPDTTLELFSKAKSETQFSTAIEMVKAAIPESLRIYGQNPLSLLHSALSAGLHAKTDEQCLELATSIRVVLTELAERISAALKDEAELRDAVNRLLKKPEHGA